jgi:hypothetical protein
MVSGDSLRKPMIRVEAKVLSEEKGMSSFLAGTTLFTLTTFWFITPSS